MNLSDYFSTGQVAKIIGKSSSTIRKWEEMGKLIPVYRSENGFRYYSKEQVLELQNSQEQDISKFENPTTEIYYKKCWECGTLMPSCVKGALIRVMCEECREKYEREKKETLRRYVELKIKVMYERALRIMEKSERVNMCEIEEAAKTIQEYALKNPNYFYSSHEMITAMVLIHNRLRIKMQYEVKSKKIDIYIPELNCGVEVDGKLHEGKEAKDSKRDVFIRNELGPEFEIVRIPTRYIEQNPMKIYSFIQESYKQKKKIRKKNIGLLPPNYSNREKEMYKEILKD